MKKFAAGFFLGMAGTMILSAYATIRRLHKNGQTYSEWVEANTAYLANRPGRVPSDSTGNEPSDMAKTGMRPLWDFPSS